MVRAALHGLDRLHFLDRSPCTRRISMPQDDISSANASDVPFDAHTPESPPTEADPDRDAAITDPDLQAARAAWENAERGPAPKEPGAEQPGAEQLDPEQLARASELAEPFVGRWNRLISTTNWEKGRIISQWRQKLVESGVSATEYSDEAWARRVGGVTAPHVGRLRRVYDRFHDSYESFAGLYWSHFLAALDWDDAPMWLEGAAKEGWSVAGMREKRWQAEGAVDSQRPTSSQIVEVETDEDFTEPAQGGGKTRDYDNDSGTVSGGPDFEGPDFGDEEELQTLPGQDAKADGATTAAAPEEESAASPVQPFIGLPALPDDLNEAVESLKLALLRHKTAGWRDVELETVQRYLDAIGIMIRN
jgi:hypothetical protein